jgi:hypothetical protein
MAAGDVTFSPAAFLPGETVNVFASDITPSLPDIATGKTGVAGVGGGLTVAAVAQTMTQHGATVPVYAVGVGATSGRRVGAVPASA